MRITQGTFSFLPDLTDEQIEAQMRYALRNGWAISVEYTDDPHPRNALLGDVGPAALRPAPRTTSTSSCARCARAARRSRTHYIKVIAYDRSLGRQTTALSFIVNRPPVEQGFRLERQDDRPTASIRYTTRTPTRPTRRAGPSAYGGSAGARADGQTAGADASTRRLAPARRAPTTSRRCSTQLDRELIALAPVKTRIREIAALLLVDRLRARGGPRLRRARRCTCRSPATPAPARRPSRCRWPRSCTGSATSSEPRVVAVHPRRPRRPVRRPHRAEDQGGAPARLRRRALHRRGLLPLPARERARLRPGGDRDPAAGDGGRARQAGRDLRRLQGPDGRRSSARTPA